MKDEPFCPIHADLNKEMFIAIWKQEQKVGVSTQLQLTNSKLIYLALKVVCCVQELPFFLAGANNSTHLMRTLNITFIFYKMSPLQTSAIWFISKVKTISNI